ncbi:acriflavine resistance protein B [Bacterioplanes sanyensis]|uniref:efflux RND transporter permease subunit n=1 Tax=Bacterioplanes sanyensis TaxID=1249553 RepID=UPI001674DABB|nr:efflux RND transporter permease subunit [Bacterioplanes sanyensis]GGY56439.1 acriflavine resistance protein B [Bacterioplanes sanyensis]
MNLTASALRNPAAAAVAVAVVLLFGLFSLTKLPVQLFPDIDRPRISINASWRGASPAEMEAEIVKPIEEVLQGLPGVKEMSADANMAWADIDLTFGIETDMQKALLEVISRMNRLPALPRDASPPTVSMAGGSNTPALTYFFLQLLPGNDTPLDDFVPFAEDVIKPRLESVPGVARVAIGGWSNVGTRELAIEFDPLKAAQLGIEIPQLAAQVSQSQDVSAGRLDVERRRYNLRFSGRYHPDDLSDMILEWRAGQPVRLGDVATVKVMPRERNDLSHQNGNAAIGIRIDRESGANVLATLERVKAVVADLRAGPLPERGLEMQQSYDASVFIYRAISLVSSNLIMGVLLAVGILWWFLRRMRATLVVAMAIPISLLGTFIVLHFAGRTLNVISLAGLAFAVGMVLDAAIVVLENIVRLRERGLPARDAALQGSQQVWGALLASTATTVAIFVPVVFLKDVEGQLFSDLALTIAIAVVLSLVVAVAVVPLMAKRWLNRTQLQDHHDQTWQRITGAIMRLTATRKRRWLVLVALISAPVGLTLSLIPELDYLPPVKRDAVDTWFRFPPATNLDTIERELITTIEARLKPYMDGDKQPALKNYYILVWGSGGGTMGVRVKDQSQVKEMERIIREEITRDLPDTMAFSSQGNLFGRFGGDRSIPIHLQSRDTEALREIARQAMGWINAALPEAQTRPEPSLEQAEPELRLYPDDRRLHENGWTRQQLASVTRTLGQGMFVGEYFDGNERMDMIVRVADDQRPETLEDLPLAVGDDRIVPLSELARLERTVGPDRIRRIDGRRTITLEVSPPEHMSLERAMQQLQTQVEPQLQAAMPADGRIIYGGSADSLKQALATLSENFLIALGILFLLMSALFRSPKDSALVVLAIPLATVGGVIALQLLNLVSFQPLDLLTMIGFVILLGLVVNNAILLVHQARIGEREGLDRHQAVEQSLRLRLRPIFMSTLTSIFGMLPLLLMPGEGSVIYRGLAAVIVGGMVVSTLFTLILLPCLLRMGKSSSPAAPQQDDQQWPKAA